MIAKSMAKKKFRSEQEAVKKATNSKSTNLRATNSKTTNLRATNKEMPHQLGKIKADGRAWQKRASAPLATPLAAEEVSRLLALLNGAEVTAAGGAWRCHAQQLLARDEDKDENKDENKDEAKDEKGVPAQGRWSLLFSLGGLPCLCRLELPSGFREKLEVMSKPWRLEELPASVALGLLSLALSSLLREIFTVPCRLVEHELIEHGLIKQGRGVEKVCSPQEVAFSVEVLPVTQEGMRDPLRVPLRLRCFLAARDLEAVGRVLRVRRFWRKYPPNLHTTWRLEAGGTSLGLEEFRALQEGDVLLLS